MADELVRIETRVKPEVRRLIRRAAGDADLAAPEWMRRVLEEAARSQLHEES
jgi:uncharacterized protein (DUF1778 family)